MSTPLTQFGLDYTQEAQARVAWDTRALRSVWTITLAAGTREYDLPADMLRLESVSLGTDRIGSVKLNEALAAISATGGTIVERSHYVIGRRLGFIPLPSQAEVVTVAGLRRPDVLTSGSDFALSGEVETLIELLGLAYALDDDRQDELAQLHMASYLNDALRVRDEVQPYQKPTRVRVRGLDPV